MEFFERAHVMKRNDSSRKDNKSEENMKKQLKQMLYGYKNNDNKAIKDSANSKVELEDTFSASSYSELDLTIASNDEVSKQDAIDSDAYIASPSDQEDAISSKESNSEHSSTKSSGLDDNGQSNSNTLDSISEIEENSKSLSSSASSDLNQNLSSENERFSFDNSTNSSNIGSESSEPFDANGVLASKILRKLNKKDKAALLPKKAKKRKLESTQKENISDIQEIQRLKISQGYESETSVSLSDEISSDESSISEVRSPSPPYVSFEATGPLSQDLNDLLKDYKHSTVKNLPTDYTLKSRNVPLFMTEHSVIDHGVHGQPQEECNNLLDDFDDNLAFSHDEDIPELSSPQQADNETMEIEHEQTLDEYQNETNQSELTLDNELSEESLDNSLTSSSRVYYCEKSCIFIMKHPAKLYIHGKVKVTPLAGTAEVFGHTMKVSCEIYAPHINFAQCIRTVETPNSYYGLFSKMTAAGMSVADTEDVVTTLGDYDVVMQLEAIKSHKLEFVERNFNVSDLFNKQSKNIENCMKQASEMLRCSLYLSRPMRYFEENPNWAQPLSNGINKQSRGIVCGGKGTGKSTFVRYYVNKLLTAGAGPVLVIDLDPGQCEFTVAGNVSATVVSEPLLGPNYTHLKTPDRMLNIGMINVMDNMRRYVNAVIHLVNYCSSNEQYQNMPWIVNTMGLCNTVGLKLMSLIVLKLQPTFLLQMDSKNVKKRFDCYLNAHTIKQTYLNEYQTDWLFKGVVCPEHFDYAFYVSHQYSEGSGKGINYFSLAPRDERYLNFLAYFGELVDIHKGIEFLGITPYEVPLQCLNVAVNVKIDLEATVKVINGKIIALCQHSKLDNSRKMFKLDDKPLLCHGHGLIRGIDYELGLLYIVTPVPAKKLSLVDTVVYGDWVPELRGQERQLPPGTPIPYRTNTLHQQRQLMFVPRRRFNPLQFLKMSRSS